MKFTRIILASLLVLLCSVGAKADETLWENYSPAGEAFIKKNVSIDWSTQSLVAELDLSSCQTSTQSEGILSIGQNINLWPNSDASNGNTIHLYYTKSATNTNYGLTIHCFNSKSETLQKKNITFTDETSVTIKLSSDGLYINGTQYVTAAQCANILTLSTIDVGSQEGNTRSWATYKSVKVTTNVVEPVDPNKPVIGETYYIVPATDTTKGLYVKDATETSTLITVGTLAEDTKYQWKLFKSPYSSSLIYFNCFQNVFSGYGLDANTSNASSGHPCQWRIEGSASGQYSNVNVNQDFDIVAVGDGTYKLAVSNGSTYYLKWNGTDETLTLTTLLEDATPFWFKNVTTTTFAKEVTLDETSTTNTSVIAGLDKTAKYTFNIKRTFKGDKWCSIVLPFDVPYTEITDVFGDGVVVARFSGHNETTLGFETITDKIEAGTPYIIKVSEDAVNSYDKDKGWTFTDIESWTDEVKDVKQGGYYGTDFSTIHYVNFHGTFNKTTVSVTATGYAKYVLSDGKIWRLTAQSNEEKGFRAIFEDQSEYGAPSQISAWTLDGNTTAIESIDGVAAPMQPQNVYNLSGQLVEAGATSTDNLPKGVYIVGGRKVVKK